MDLSAMIKRAIEIGERPGFITFDPLNELTLLSATTIEAEDIEILLGALSDRGIDVREA
ncbi:RNA polymerase subunit sigma-70 [Bradyrhizobium sp. CCBAU 051011]|uniref:RNA polymerase sigma factor region1.1 domain-containing protein n=1 Tax=Bradyrhizobium sp. CCBAU 051011 TaxID=858422 RepID=UPI0013745E77|nr:RNA polymerase sigma factor region1.1 domain-containing protein [Bradyrhizobium sp. CCBAU 051011]QHO77435.1 RNA polymerase subunit sigma-70 [Bradyrhizobium sp. CCBAU 051011]